MDLLNHKGRKRKSKNNTDPGRKKSSGKKTEGGNNGDLMARKYTLGDDDGDLRKEVK